ncbi:hypothetical protein KY361_07245 [Candidatus Woesearchaeota archaeon]|nr:hypothetical protein [Candidatus Woesearchaeota archaeon]
MEYLNKVINLQDYKLEYRQELFEIILYTVVSFFLPFFVGHPQIVVGVLVNTFLITSALNVKGTKLLPVIIAPSLGALSRGILFGPFTVFLIYMIPFIWIGNSILVFAFKWLNLDKKLNRWVTLLIGAITKAAFLFGVAYLLVSMKILPVLFLTTMGIFQLYTAVLGGMLALGFHSAKKNLA